MESTDAQTVGITYTAAGSCLDTVYIIQECHDKMRMQHPAWDCRCLRVGSKLRADVEGRDGNSPVRIKVCLTIASDKLDFDVVSKLGEDHLAVLSFNGFDAPATDHFFHLEGQTSANGLDDSWCSSILPRLDGIFIILGTRRYKRDGATARKCRNLGRFEDGAFGDQQASASRSSNELVR